MHKLNGGCHCENIHFELELSHAPDTYNPRACDCDFCRKHGAAYLSDPGGSLTIHVRNDRLLGKYRQGSGTAECLLCTNCGVLIGVAYRNEGAIFAAINSNAVDAGTTFGERKPVSPKTLATNEKVERWKSLWFPKVSIITPDA